MTTSEALAQIPEIVAKAIPLNPPLEITCEAKRNAWLENAKWRRNELTGKIQRLIFKHEGHASVGIKLDLDDLMNKKEEEY